MIRETKKVLEECKQIQEEYSYFTAICEEEALLQAETANGPLRGLFVSVKDCLCVKGVESAAGSRILKGYQPLFDATVIKRLKDAGAIIIGKTAQDEFGFGSFNTNVGLNVPIPKNPLDRERVTGGSSGGGAGLTRKASFNHVAITESTGGSIESPAAFCGVVGFCPTYGRVSRYGLISYADSLDKIGIMSKTVSEIKPVLEIISGYDEKDATSLKEKVDFTAKTGKFKIGIIKESLTKGVDAEIKKKVQWRINKLKDNGHTVEEVSLPITFAYGIPAYYIISTSEASSNLARFCGLRYGQESNLKNKTFNVYFAEIRSQHFNEESKRRIILGTFARMAGYRDAYYIKATKVRTKIIQEYKQLFQKYDVLISPTMPVVAPKFSEVKKMTPLENYLMDILTVGPNLAGIPHASIPIGKVNNLPVGLMANTDHLQEGKLLEFLQIIEDLGDDSP